MHAEGAALMRVAVQARRRALGNIQFIGHLYKQKMLTEKIMHSCITTLLGEVTLEIVLIGVHTHSIVHIIQRTDARIFDWERLISLARTGAYIFSVF